MSRLSRTCSAVQDQLVGYRPSAALTSVREFFWGDMCDWYLELIKPRINSDEADADASGARQTVATVLDGVLRLLHPFVPFITETLWSRLRKLAIRRGIANWQPPDSDLLAMADWPRPDKTLESVTLEADMDWIRDVARAIRDLRSQHGVDARKPIAAVIRPTGGRSTRISIEGYDELIRRAAILNSLDFGAIDTLPSDSASTVVGDHEVHLLNVVDVEVENRRLAKQYANLNKQIEISERKLANPGFLKNAAESVVERERQRLATTRSELRSVQQKMS